MKLSVPAFIPVHIDFNTGAKMQISLQYRSWWIDFHFGSRSFRSFTVAFEFRIFCICDISFIVYAYARLYFPLFVKIFITLIFLTLLC